MSLSVLTLNIWNDDGPWTERAKRIRSWIERLDPDLIGLQEVLRGESIDQLEALLEGLGYHTAYARAQDFWKHPTTGFGNAIAARFPILDSEELRLPESGDGERRVALFATLDAPFGPVELACTHLNWKFHHGAVREQQVATLCARLIERRPRGGFPPILVGDFNADPDSAEIRYVTGKQSLAGHSMYLRDSFAHAGDAGDGSTWCNRNPYARPALEPDRRIDYVFVGPPRPDGTGLPETCRVVCNEPDGEVWPSDHFGLLATLRTEALA